MNHWYLCWLDVWWWIRWIAPAFCGWAWIDLVRSFLKKESPSDGDFNILLICVAVLGAVYYFSIKSLGVE